MVNTNRKVEGQQRRPGAQVAGTHADAPQLAEPPEKPPGHAIERLRPTHQAASYDQWFRAEITQALQEADNPTTLWLDNATVMAESAERRAQWRKQAPGGQAA